MNTKDRILSETPEAVKEKVRETANDLVGEKETLEEAAENWLDKYSDKFEIIKSKFLPFHYNNRNELTELINEVIKWQQERNK